jgi:molybdate transport system substrate-binding protein
MATIRVFSGGAPKPVFNHLSPAFERESGHKVDYVFAVMSTLRDKIAGGEAVDVLVMPTNLLDPYQKEGVVKGEGRAVLGLVPVNAVVKAGAPKPDLSTVEKARKTILTSRAVTFATPGATPSGSHMGQLIEKFGGAGALSGKIIHRPALEGGVDLVRSGEAEIGFYPKSEVMGIDGITIAGPLPKEIQLTTIYGAAVTARSKAPDAAAAFIAFMSGPTNRAAWTDRGFDPP